MDFIRVNLKAVLTFVIATLLQAVTDAFNTGHVPASLSEWGRYLGLALLGGVIVWATGNKLDLGQILAGMKKLPTPDQKTVAEETLTVLPNTVSDTVVNNYPVWATGD
jgi:hypothetical protein